MDSLEKIEEYLASVEEYFFSSFSTLTSGIPDVHEAANRLWIDISRYGPGLPAFPEVRIPSLGDFQVPPPPPPPPSAPLTHWWLEKPSNWIMKSPWKATGIVVSTVGAGLLIGYGMTHTRRRSSQRLRTQQAKPADRRQVVVVLGADSPFGLPLVLELEKKGYIVIVSVASPEAVEPLEERTQGYVKALVLDPYEPLMIPAFLRSLTATLSRKFPINAAGDPFAPLSSHPHVHSVISLLSLPESSNQILAPLEHISLPETYLPYLTATQITPLQVIQSLLPLLRTSPAITRDKRLKKTIVVCIPAIDARVGLPFAGIRSMSVVAMARGAEVLRREIRAAAATGKGAEAMRDVNVVVVDAGTFNVEGGAATGNGEVWENVSKAMETWTPSEKVTYGPAFASVLQSANASTRRSPWETFVALFKGTNGYGVSRKPTDVSAFVNTVVSVVSGGRGEYSIYGVGLGLGRLRNWIRGERFSVGAGAHTYKFASYLPSVLLDGLLNIPHFLIGVRNRLLITQPFRQPSTLSRPPAPSPHTRPKATPVAGSQSLVRTDTQKHADSEEAPSDRDETSSDYDADSVAGDSGVDSSWVSLNGSQTQLHGEAAT